MANKPTPMMQQYFDIKKDYEDCILFFRLGDFYEMFYSDAITASKEINLTLTGKSCGLEERAPMCGVPYHSADTYVTKLVDKGYKVAICEQAEDPAAARGIVKREVTRIITPGTVIGQTMLKEDENNYLASVYRDNSGIGLAYCDISTGELRSAVFGEGSGGEYDNAVSDLLNEICRIDPKEIILFDKNKPEGDDDAGGKAGLDYVLNRESNSYISLIPESYCEKKHSAELICRQFGVKSAEGLGIDVSEPALPALGGLLSYLFETQKQSLEQIKTLHTENRADHMILSKSAVRNLELIETLFEKKTEGSLLGILDKTETSMGARLLKVWIKEPLNKTRDINRRLDAVEFLSDDIFARNDIREALKKVYDLERLSGRIACGMANGRDMLALASSFVSLPDIKALLEGSGIELLEDIGNRISDMSPQSDRIFSAIREDPPVSVKEGNLIRDGYSEELDGVKRESASSLEWIANLENAERERTGIKKLKLGFNKVFGYYLEVSKSNADKVPDDYIRKQTLVNNERFVTAELKEMESRVLNAESRINELEYRIFTELREYLKEYIADMQSTARAVAELDVLTSFAEVGCSNGYVRPVVDDSDIIEIKGGRHPVIEHYMDGALFVPNDVSMNRDDRSFLLITGPNMSGKSTYMRQTALIILMAQMGCFVPAESAGIGVVDRIFTRIGASDNLSQGQSTFYVEMSELALILNTATERSFIILDEIGRGTSTYDGLSIAWAVAEYLTDSSFKVRTLFASHYHELTELEKNIRGFKNLNVDVSEDSGEIVFLHRIKEGSASRSYGIHVAKIAGVPAALLETAQKKLDSLEKSSSAAVLYKTDDQRDQPRAKKERVRKSGPNEADSRQISFLASSDTENI